MATPPPTSPMRPPTRRRSGGGCGVALVVFLALIAAAGGGVAYLRMDRAADERAAQAIEDDLAGVCDGTPIPDAPAYRPAEPSEVAGLRVHHWADSPIRTKVITLATAARAEGVDRSELPAMVCVEPVGEPVKEDCFYSEAVGVFAGSGRPVSIMTSVTFEVRLVEVATAKVLHAARWEQSQECPERVLFRSDGTVQADINIDPDIEQYQFRLAVFHVGT